MEEKILNDEKIKKLESLEVQTEVNEDENLNEEIIIENESEAE